jgi:ketosteroid isomerase-like protein
MPSILTKLSSFSPSIHNSLAVVIALALLSPSSSLASDSEDGTKKEHQHDQMEESSAGSPLAVTKSYFEAMDASDLDAAEALFATSSSIFETGGVEGSWSEYRSHHLGPEIDAIKVFSTELGDAEHSSSEDGSMAFVAWPIQYHIELQDGRKIDSNGTVTFVLTHENDDYRIRHLHWSSRRKQ